MKRVFIDMDNVLVDFQSGLDQVSEGVKAEYDGRLDEIPGLFAKMKPMEGAIEAVHELQKRYDLFILSTAPWKNPSAWSDKVTWVTKYLDDVFHKRMVITHRKDLCQGDYLIDDRGKNGTSEFGGEWIKFGSERFPNWESVLRYLLKKDERWKLEMKRLSKSRYTAFCQCPKNLWLKAYKPEEATIDAGMEARFAQGNVVGDLAMGLFGDFKEVTAHQEDGSLDLKKMIELTKQYMDEGVENICEASFSCEGGYCAVDILRNTPEGWAIYEVKSTSFPEFNGKEAKLEKYAPDIAYQKWVLEQCGVKVTGTYLVCLNSNYVRHGELDVKQLFVVNDMKELVENEYMKVQARVGQAMKVINSEQEPDVELSECCMKPYGCAFWEYCKRQHGVPSPSVFDVYGGKGRGGFTFKKKLDCYRQGLVSFEDLRSTDIGPIQNMQIEAALTGKEFINPEGIRKFLDRLSYPIYFLDFETMQDAVPQYDGAKVYAQITFQYSLHVKEIPDTVVERNDNGRRLKIRKSKTPIHREFLAPSDGSDPRRPLAEQLCRDIPMDACTVAYNKMFECGRIRELAALYPDLAPHLLNIADHIVDLIDPFRAGYYYVPAMGGSFSIKSVLPALFPNDPELDYHNLDARCQNGGDAMTIFPRLQQMEQSLPKQGVQNRDGLLVMADSLMPLREQIRIREEIAASRKALLDYCELDTWAMVKVWEKLKEVAE